MAHPGSDLVQGKRTVALRASASVAEALSHIRARRHSRIPIFEGDLDHITGVLYAKDLLGAGGSVDPAMEARRFARPAFFVPEKMRARQGVWKLM